MINASDSSDIDEAVAQIRAGNSDAFRVIIVRCEAHLRMIVSSILPNSGSVDDVVQKAFVTAFFRLDQYEIGTSFPGWVTTIARYEALNERRRYYTEHAFRERFKADYNLNEKLYGNENISNLASPFLHEKLQQCLARLREKAANIIRAYYLEKIQVEDLAKQYGQTNDWVHLTLHRARKNLRNCLGGIEQTE